MTINNNVFVNKVHFLPPNRLNNFQVSTAPLKPGELKTELQCKIKQTKGLL